MQHGLLLTQLNQDLGSANGKSEYLVHNTFSYGINIVFPYLRSLVSRLEESSNMLKLHSTSCGT